MSEKMIRDRKIVQKGWAKCAAVALLLSSLFVPFTPVMAATPRDNDANAVIWGGCYTKAECLDKINKGDGHNSSASIKKIVYEEGRGITASNFNASYTVSGTVTSDGKVIVDGKTVATGAQSVGRSNISGSHKSGSVWERPTSVSFLSTSLPAYVNMEGGKFRYAMIKACGNPVRATPVKPSPTSSPSKTPKPTPSKTPVITHSPSPSPFIFRCVDVVPTEVAKTDKAVTFRFTVKESHSSNVQVTGYRFSFSDDTPVVDTSVNQPFLERQLSEGSLRVYGQVKTSAGITALSENCSANVSVATVTPTPTPTPSTPEKGGSVLGATLPATGPETVLGGVAGLTAIGFASRAYVRSRKSLLDALRNKISK